MKKMIIELCALVAVVVTPIALLINAKVNNNPEPVLTFVQFEDGEGNVLETGYVNLDSLMFFTVVDDNGEAVDKVYYRIGYDERGKMRVEWAREVAPIVSVPASELPVIDGYTISDAKVDSHKPEQETVIAAKFTNGIKDTVVFYTTSGRPIK